MIICYSGKSKPSATAIADESEEIEMIRSSERDSDINWGRSWANSILNPDISNSVNKRVMRELFEENGVPMPKLVDETIALTFPWDDNPIVGRPDKHTKGRGFWLCRNQRDVQRALQGTRKKKPATHFMEYILADHEYRVHVFNGKSIRISEKSFFTDDNGRRAYTTVKPTGNIKHVRKAAKLAVESLGLDFGAVDILATDSECWVLEVNAAPGLGGTMPKLYAETFLKWKEENDS